jgi:DNA processing protein
MDQAQADWLLAALTPGMGAAGLLKLVRAFGSVSAALEVGVSQLAPLIGMAAAQALRQRSAEDECAAAQAWAEHSHGFLLTLLDQDYPPQLAESDTPPPLLFGLGRRELLTRPMLAIVGSRNAFEPACATARAFADSLAQHGYTIVSGLASGIDSAAHQGALAQPASSVAVVGTGIDRVYPASNHALAQQLARDGLILSEFPLGAKPLAHHFPRRNRIIAGLCRACLVVEASVESGSLITARLAAEAGREVMAIPGSIHNPQARGCHRLIKQGAKLVETVDDILEEVGRLPRSGPVGDASASAPPPHSPLYAQMGPEPVSIDQLSTKLGLTAAELYAILLQLELEGRVASLPGGRFQRLDLHGSGPDCAQ